MSDIVIRVHNLSKRYRIGLKERIPDTFVGALAGFAQRPIKNLLRLRRLTQFEENGHKPADVIWALKEVSFEVKEGEIVGIIGRNGAGKTTLLKILSRITAPTSGRVEVRGRVSSLLEVGTGFHSELTGRENIYLNGTILGMKKTEIDRKFDEIVAFSGVERFIDTPVKRYSSGMHVRLAFAVAAHLEPEIMLVDEVLAVGDADFQRKCLGKMGNVAKEGRTVLFVSHNLSAINRLCPRTILLNNGEVLKDGATGETLHSYTEMSSIGDLDGDLSSPELRAPQSNPASLFKWTYISILNSQGKPAREIRFGEPFEIVFGGYASRKCENVLIGLGVTSKITGIVFTTHQTYNGLPDTLPEGISEFHVKMNPNMLAPGFYETEIAAEGAGIGDCVPYAIGLQVLDLPITPDKFWYAPQKAGVVDYPCKWSLEIPTRLPTS